MTSPVDKYLPWNPDAKGIVTTESGVQYIVVKDGPKDGKKPVSSDRVSVHYDGRLPTGEKFDSSLDRGSPAEFRLDQVIPGWTIGLQEMSEGDEFVFYIPNRLAYGQQRAGMSSKPETILSSTYRFSASWNPRNRMQPPGQNTILGIPNFPKSRRPIADCNTLF